jgi:hypothetical protein
VQCCQCHNHKYDPITQEEYYRLFAFINNDHEARPAVYTPEEQRRIAGIHRGVAELEAELKHRLPDWESRLAHWEEQISRNQPEWQVVWPLFHEGDNAQR